jgi:hypothetical protein
MRNTFYRQQTSKFFRRFLIQFSLHHNSHPFYSKYFSKSLHKRGKIYLSLSERKKFGLPDPCFCTKSSSALRVIFR